MALPIILAHGIARFDAIIPATDYWGFVRNVLGNAGYTLHETNVSWAGSLEIRAKSLATQVNHIVDSNGYSKVNIIGHSMGGLDARVALIDEGLAPRVNTLVTLGTPHHGSSFADWLVGQGVNFMVSRILQSIGIDLTGVADLTRTACAEFNDRVKDAEESCGVT